MKSARIFGFVAAFAVVGVSGLARAQYASPYGPYASTYVRYPRADIGFFALCFASYPSAGEPVYQGYCPSVRLRFTNRLGVALDPNYVSIDHGIYKFGMFGFRPSFQFSIAQGRGQSAPSTFYALGGMDLWVPTTSRDKTPSVFLGGHVGLGALVTSGRIGLGAELRGLVRAGVGNQDNAVAQDMAMFRFGYEIRIMTIHVSIW